MRKTQYLFYFLLITIFSSCSYNIDDALIGNQEPNTYLSLYPDSVISQQPSKINVHWTGDDKDGLVIGYYISYADDIWTFTTKNDSSIAFPIKGMDTTYLFKVSAVDNSGNGVYDNAVYIDGKNIGPEPFTDLNGDKIYNPGEPFVDIGAIDQTPAELKYPLKNTSPEVGFLKDNNGNLYNIPETTFTVASFSFNASDLDGDETIVSISVALNDTSKAIQLPGNTRFITLKGLASSGSTTNCSLYIGSSITTPYAQQLSNLKLDDDNVLYVWATDIAGAKSQLIRMPAEGSSLKWHVKKPKGDILIIDDYSINDNTATFYNSIFDSLNLSHRVDIYNIGLNKTTSVSGSLMPKFINPMFTETMKLFKYVFWYSDTSPSFEAAQTSVRTYLNAGGHILFSMQFPQIFDGSVLYDFLPVDSVSNVIFGTMTKGTKIQATSQGLGLNYPSYLQVDQSSIPVQRVRGFYPNPLTAVPLYYIDASSKPTTCFKNNESNLVFIGLPLNRLNDGNFNIKKFFQKVFFSEFGVSK